MFLSSILNLIRKIIFIKNDFFFLFFYVRLLFLDRYSIKSNIIQFYSKISSKQNIILEKIIHTMSYFITKGKLLLFNVEIKINYNLKQ